ncbi:amino acid ABC transporter substrate-binding protein [Actinomyces vulturis]|uniref:amino acid ABC transporter substrate-binding protein n=1 Tax=Actinomyces vulturis TaxID=1857645 RepID=UPI00082B03C5|nr:amino acid ABC transporter substrate-binding protein [Actinomyces vulturis]
MTKASPLSRRALLLSGLFSAGALSLSACSSSLDSVEHSQSAMDKDVVVLGYDNTFVPMGYDDNGITKGFDVDLAEYVFTQIGKKYRWENIDWAMKEAELTSGKIDAIWSGYTVTPERLKKVSATDTYLTNDQTFMVLEASDITSKADLAGKQVATQAGSSALDLITADTDFLNSIDGAQPLLYDTYDKALRDLEVGRADAVAGDYMMLGYYAKARGAEKYRILDENMGTESCVVAVRKDDPAFLQALNQGIEDAKNDGTLDNLTSTWFG